MQTLGQTPDISIQGVVTSIEEVGPSANLAGLGNRGVAFLDASQPSSLPQTAPVFSSASSAQPPEDPAVGTLVSMAGTNLASSPQVRFGATNPINASAASASQLQVSSPASVVSGPVNLTAYFTIRGSGFQSGIKATLGGKSATVSLQDMNTLLLTAPALTAGSQRLVLTNPSGEAVSYDAAYVTQ